MLSRQKHQASPVVDSFQPHTYHYRRRGNNDSISSTFYPNPYPPHLVLERSPSQPSLTNSNSTDVSDEYATTPTTPMHTHRDSDPSSVNTPLYNDEFGGDVSGSYSPKSKTRPSVAALFVPAAVDNDQLSLRETPQQSSAASFTDKRQRRLSLSRSLQNLRDKTDKAARRRSSVSADKLSTPPLADDLPPVPSVPAIYLKEPATRRSASATATMQTPSATPSPTVATPVAAPTKQPSTPSNSSTPSPSTHRQASSGSSLGNFFRKLTGRKGKGKENKAPPPPTRGPTSAPVAGTLTRRPMELKPKPVVPQVAPPSSVKAVLAEMGASSAEAERKQTNRKSMIKRVPVPIYDVEGDVIIPRRSADKASKPPPMPENAAEARQAALAALEGSPRTRTAKLPSSDGEHSKSSSSDGEHSAKAPSTDGEKSDKRPSTISTNSTDSDPVIKTVAVSPPLVTQVIVMEPKSVSPTEVDLTNDDQIEISPTKQSIRLVPSRSQSGSSINSGVDSIRRMSRTQKLSDFGTYDSSSDGSDEGGDITRPLQLRIPPRSTESGGLSPRSQRSTESGGLSPRSPRTPLSASLPVTPEDAPPVTPSSSSFDHSSIAAHSASEFGSYNDVGLGLKRTSTTSSQGPRSPYSMSHTISSSGHSPRDPRFAGSRSAYVAPVGDGLTSSEGHSGRAPTTRIRTAAATTLGRRLSQRPKEPPTSHDAYMQRQAEIARRRQSCKPMIHSRASIAAELTEVRDKEEGRVMETFFMS